MDMLDNLVLDTDSYKPSHIFQFPQKTTNAFYYLESRGGRYGSTVFFGLQILLETLAKRVTKENVEEAAEFLQLMVNHSTRKLGCTL